MRQGQKTVPGRETPASLRSPPQKEPARSNDTADQTWRRWHSFSQSHAVLAFVLVAILGAVVAALHLLWADFGQVQSQGQVYPQSVPHRHDMDDSRVVRRPIKVHLVWTTPAETFRERNLKVIDTYFYHHPVAQLSVYATHLPMDFFQDYRQAGYQIEVVRLTDTLLFDMAAECLPAGSQWMSKLDEWKRGPFYYSHITDFVRFCVLYRHGGIYSDFDALLLQRIDRDVEFIGRDSSGANGSCHWCLPGGDGYLAPGLMGSEPGSALIKRAMSIGFDVSTYNASVFNAVGPQAITKAYMAMRKENLPTPVQIYDSSAFYPYSYLQAQYLLVDTADAWARVEQLQRTSKSLHFYGHRTRNLEVTDDSILRAVFDRYAVVVKETASEPCVLLRGTDHFEMADWPVQLLPDIRLIQSTQCRHSPHVALTIVAKAAGIRLAGTMSNFSAELHLNGINVMQVNELLTRVLVRLDEKTISDESTRATLSFTLTLANVAQPVARHAVTVYNTRALVTVIVKTFGRMEKAFNLVRSMRKFYPLTQIVIADDAENVQQTAGKYKDFTFMPLPYDVGLSAGRNRMIDAHVHTPYFLTLDDDFLWTENSRLADLIYALESGELDIAAAKNPSDEQKFELDFCGQMRVAADRADDLVLHLEPGQTGSTHGCNIVDFVPNIFLGRTALFKTIMRWDESLKLGEHEDFFLRAKQLGVRVGTCPSVAFTHDQVPHWLRRTKYDMFRNRVYDFWRDSLRKHGLVRLVSFGRVMMDLVLPEPIKCLTVAELLAYSLTLEWMGCSDAPAFSVMLSTDGRTFSTVNGGDGGEHAYKWITIRDLRPATKYWFLVFAGNRFDFEQTGRQTVATTLSRSAARGLLKNGGFEQGHFEWTVVLGTHFHTVANRSHTGRFAGRLSIPTRGYTRKYPTQSTLSQSIDEQVLIQWNNRQQMTTLPPHRQIVVAGWSKVERLYGSHVEWRLGARVEFKNGNPVSYTRDFDRSSAGWQIQSFTLCIAPYATVTKVQVFGQLVAYRGSVFFDDFTLLLQ